MAGRTGDAGEQYAVGEGAAEAHVVDSSDGVRIAAWVQGRSDGPTLLLAHGWPNSHVMWTGVVQRLADRFRIITYDNRGTGASTVPAAVSAYTMPRFADDVSAVIEALAPDGPVHVLAHDWGSVGVWEYLARPEAATRVASFTSVSGPSTDHYARVIREGLRRPYRPRQFLRSLHLALRLTYWIPFSVPVLMPWAMRAGLARRLQHRHARGVPASGMYYGDIGVDAARSLKIYRANAIRSTTRVRREHRVEVPVQLLVNTGDPVIKPAGYDDEHRWVPRLWRRDVPAGHWSPLSHPQVLARAVAEFVDHLGGAPASRDLRRAEVRTDAGRRAAAGDFADALVVVTGAGSGIGRETALAFAREGAEVVVSDIDADAAADTAAAVTARGGRAHHRRVDVSDGAAMDAFAEQVCTEIGVPDIVVNNAGIGHAGRFLDTPAEQFDRVLDVNFGGVVNGCRAFAPRLVEHGMGGHVVNVSSMAAYAPQQQLNAYCTSKAAVFMFSDCLRAELADAGIGLTTLCPGVVDTPIVHNTRIDAPAGRADDVAGRRAQLEKAYAVRGYGPEKVASAILSSVRRDSTVRPVTAEAHVVYAASRLAPRVMRRAARGRVL